MPGARSIGFPWPYLNALAKPWNPRHHGEVAEIVVRKMVESDVSEVKRLWYQSWLDTYARPDLGVTREWVENEWKPLLSVKAHDDLAQEVRNPSRQGRFIVAELGNQIAGFAAPSVDGDRGQRVGALYVAAKHLGCGVGAALMHEAFDGFDPSLPVSLEVASFNTRAIRFYEKWGFQRIPGSDQTYKDVVPEFWMRREPLKRPVGFNTH